MKTRLSPARKTSIALSVIASLGLLTGCVNSKLSSLGSQFNSLSNTSPTTSASGTPSSASGDNFKLANITVTVPSNGATPLTTLYIDPAHSVSATAGNTPLISNHCTPPGAGGGQTAKPCICQFTWTESNGTAGSTVAFVRTVQTSVTNTQQALVSCQAPDVFSTEIADGTSVKITVLPAPSNQEVFSVTPYSYTKNSTQVSGSFRDAAGHSFENVMHYACYEQFKKSTVIQSKIGQGSNPTTGEQTSYPMANQFCIQTGEAPSASCPNGGSLNFSAQASYYNFFVRSTEAGDVNQWNDRFTCPVVKEALAATGTVGSQSSLWPLDTTFALSVGKTPDFNLGINSFVELANGGADPVSKGAKTCDGSGPASNGSNNGFVQACLGFAAKPNPDGTCPYFRDSNGQIRFTYRLRKYTTIYPQVFDATGNNPTHGQSTDSVYVLDRPVTPPNGSDILKPYTMAGPKPCPFALFDYKNVINTRSPPTLPKLLPQSYVATNNSNWTGKNVDDTHFPDEDFGSLSASAEKSCSTAMSIAKIDPLNQDQVNFSITTINASNGQKLFSSLYPLGQSLQRVYVRPIQAWAPHYEEDTDFQACAPQAFPLKDPPLHFAKDITLTSTTLGNVSWCSESYPSQNDHVAAIDNVTSPDNPVSSTNKYLGNVRPFTSHVAKQSVSATCTASLPTIPGTGITLYPAASTPAGATCNTGAVTGIARHASNDFMDTLNTFATGSSTPPAVTAPVCANNTCDRTAIPAGGAGWQSFPLLAPAADVERALATDSSYNCTITYDNGGAKTGKLTPTQGCCGTSVQVYTGAKGAAAAIPQITNTSAHLEPDAACLTPTY